MAVGKLIIYPEPTEHGCVKFSQHLWPNGWAWERNDYEWGRLMLREGDFHLYVKAMEDSAWEVEVQSVPSYARGASDADE
jgi:hypothetical protein